MFTFIWAIIIGLIIGGIAKMLMPGKQPGGIIVTIILGMAGSSFATWLGQFLHLYHSGEKAGFFFSIIGALIILYLYKKAVEVMYNNQNS
ncbi:GlsB/YeaQ/YmgE family stress response membrane protein [Commensalibacter oyaizuii]|uniref:GlsB/YeaQ/YmgE family stress response membrane protein n=1 Tax=Commensalibacter oyaizuii TaxID=3043873 RepID=A0ABT6PZV9_9PROT|nr:GlsB/YeaQ/YmgE family stress response membrane protein [Commensalibacter sp. TBRC 16381]MDI2090402.1 GlsB/YeaQ/YmgE family stress response membrane protein [Commensalibacter sp. TBRC 16381]